MSRRGSSRISRLALHWTLLIALTLAACGGTRFEPPEVQGAPLMAAVDEQPLLLVLTKQEERREVRVGTGRYSSSSTRTDTLFHFDLRAYDPRTATPKWRARLVTFSDPKSATAARQTRIIGSATSGFLLGQEQDRLWLQIADVPMAVSVRDGSPLVDGAAIEQANPELKGRLPSEARFYGFDRGLVVHASDARRWVIRGAELKARAWSPATPPATPVALKANGMPKIVPLRPLHDAHTRMATIGPRHIGLYSQGEAQAASQDPFGDRLAYPYSILDEGAGSRRSFWTVHTRQVQRFEERYERIERMEPIPDSAVFLRGRFVKHLPGDDALQARDPDGAFVWHSSRIDDEGRLSLTRVNAALEPLWTVELPLSESGTVNRVRYWLLGDHLVAMGEWTREIEYQRKPEPVLVGVALGDGRMVAHSLGREPTSKSEPAKVSGRIDP